MPYIANNPSRFKDTIVGNGHCVAFARAAALMPHTGTWERGGPVKGDNTIAIGTAIATFDDNGHYANQTNGTSHVAIYLGQTAVGIQVMDQWVGQVVHERTIDFKHAIRKVNDGRNYYVVE
ncbi:MAG: BPSL0067 family protein [Pseudomonadota bacterium]